MKIQPIVSTRNFGQIFIKNNEYEKILKPYEVELNNLTNGYDVYIQEEQPLYVYDKYSDDSYFLHGLPSVTINPQDSANSLIPEMKIIVYPGAGEMQGASSNAQDIIKIIKKAISLYSCK